MHLIQTGGSSVSHIFSEKCLRLCSNDWRSAEWDLATAILDRPNCQCEAVKEGKWGVQIRVFMCRSVSVCVLFLWCEESSCYFGHICHVYSTSLLTPWLFCLQRRCVLTARAVRMAALWYNLPNYLSSILPHIIPLAAAAWDEIGFCACLTAAAASTKTDNYLCTPPQSCFFFFFVSLPLFLSHSVVGRSPWIIHQCEMKKLMDIEYPLRSGGQPCGFSSLFFFFFQLKRVKSGRSHCQDIWKVNDCFTFCTYLFSSWSVTGDECLERDGEMDRMWWKGMELKSQESYLCSCGSFAKNSS